MRAAQSKLRRYGQQRGVGAPQHQPRQQTPEAARQAAAEADLAYKMDKWPRYLFKDETKEGGFLSEAVGLRQEGTWPAMCRELFGRLYGHGTRPRDEVPSGNEWAAELHRQADAVPEWKQLEQRVAGDPWRAAMGAGQVAHLLAPHVPEMPEENAGALQDESDLMQDLAGNRVNAKFMAQRGALQQRIAAARKTGDAAVAAMQAQHGFAVRSALRGAAQGALQAIDDAETGMQGLGAGLGTTLAVKRALMLQMANNDKLRRIAVLAGRLRVQAARKQRTKSKQERSELVSVTVGDDLEHLTASEVGMLARPESRLLVLNNVAEKRALQYQLGGTSTKTRGPLVFLIDCSGSMNGTRDEWSKACAMALMEVARIQKRPYAVGFFDTVVKYTAFFDAGANTPEKVMEVLGVAANGGGTCIHNALQWADAVIGGDKLEVVDNEYRSAGKWSVGKDSDVVLITDGEDHSPKDDVCQALRDKGASLYTIGIECEPPEDLRRHSVECVHMSAADMKSASPKLDGVFSL